MTARWAKPRRFDRNLVVIGAGSAGLVSALVAAKTGAAVTLIEANQMGGDCLNTGCVPSKAIIHAARLVSQARAAEAMGLLGHAGTVDPAAALRHVRASVQAVAPHDSVERYRGFGVDVRRGHATITSPWTVEIGGITLTTRSIVIAAGAEPAIPEIAGLADAGYLTSETLWDIDRVPPSLLVLGGGPIGCELSQAFARLGSAVTLVQQAERLLEREDDEVAALVRAHLERDGARVLTGHKAISALRRGGRRVLTVQGAGGVVELEGDAILVAVGRKPRTAGYGLEALAIPLTARGTVETNDYLQTLYPNIYACGDVAGPYQFTHAAGHQGWHASVNALFGQFHRIRLGGVAMPAVTYTEPEIARVGLNEREAKAQGIPYELTRHDLRELDRAIVDDARDGFIKVLTKPGKDSILGATIAAPRAGEMLAELSLAMRHGLGLKKVLGTIHPYPTYTEANRDTGSAWLAAHTAPWIVRWLTRYHSWMRRE